MGKIIRQFRKLKENGDVLFIATLDVDGETEEGYCLEVGDGYTDRCTSFGNGVAAEILAVQTFEAVCFLSTVIVDRIGTRDEQAFWDAFFEEFEDGWLFYDSENDEVCIDCKGYKQGRYELTKFINKWHPDNKDSISVKCPHCHGSQVSFFESKGSQLVDKKLHHYEEVYIYECQNEACNEYFDVKFLLKPLSVEQF